MTWTDITTKYGQFISGDPIDGASFNVVLSTFYRDRSHADRVLSAISNEIASELRPKNEGPSASTGELRYHVTHAGRLTGAQVKEYLITVADRGGEIYEVFL